MGGTIAAVVVVLLAAVFFILFWRRRSRLVGEKVDGDIERPTSLPIAATDITLGQIQTGLNNIATDIKSIASKAGASELDPSRAASIIKSVQAKQGGKQGGKQQALPTTKVEALQALQASIAMTLTSHVMPLGDPPVHPLFDKKDAQRKEFKQWVASQPGYAEHEDLKGARARQWAAKYVREHFASDAALSARGEKLITNTTGAIQRAIAELYPGLEDEQSERIEKLARSALELTIEMMGRDLAIIADWPHPGETFSDDWMEMTDISKLEGVVALCIFPRWMDSDRYTITKARVYCVAAAGGGDGGGTTVPVTVPVTAPATDPVYEDSKTQVDVEI